MLGAARESGRMGAMGDLSAEPSMEEILSSIKRIIAEEGEAPVRGRRLGRPGAPNPAALAAAVDEVLELSDPMPATPAAAELSRRAEARAHMPPPVMAAPATAAPLPDPFPVSSASMPMSPPLVAAPAPAEPEPAPRVQPAMAAPEPAIDPAPEPIASPRTVDASRGALDSLSRMMVKPDATGDGTLEGLVKEMLRPMLREWLDKNLPSLVEDMVAREIARISPGRD